MPSSTWSRQRYRGRGFHLRQYRCPGPAECQCPDGSCRSAAISPRVWARALTRRSAVQAAMEDRERIARGRSKGPTWCSLPQVWAVVRARGRRRGRAGRSRARHPDRGRRHASRFDDGGRESVCQIADQGIYRSRNKYVDSLITIPNEKLLDGAGRRTARCSMLSSRSQRSPAGCRAGHRRTDHPPGPDQRRLCRRTDRDGRDGHGNDGFRQRIPARTGRVKRPRQPCRARCSRTSTSQGARGILVNVTAGHGPFHRRVFRRLATTVKECRV